MFTFIKKNFNVLLNFDGWLAIKWLSLNSQPCQIKATLTIIDINSNEPFYYPFVVSDDKCDLHAQMWVQTNRKYEYKNNLKCKIIALFTLFY